MPAREIRLKQAQALRGQVLDQHGWPLAGTAVTLDSWQGSKALHWSVTTDSSGRFEWKDAPEENAFFQLTRNYCIPLNGVALQPAEQEHRITMQRKKPDPRPVE
jgi:hypothetical protein